MGGRQETMRESGRFEIKNLLLPHAGKFIKKDGAFYTVSRGEMGQCQQKAVIQWDEASGKLIRQCYTRGTQDISGPIITVS